MSLEEYLSSDIHMSKVDNPTQIVAFVASWCPHSRVACKQLVRYDVDKQIYAVDLESFVDPNNLKRILRKDASYKRLYDDYISNNVNYKWKYPHIFMKDTKWHYIGGEERIKQLKF